MKRCFHLAPAVFSLSFFVLFFIAISASPALAERSGSCGVNVRWRMDDEGTLTISGKGPMQDYSATSPSPFYGDKSILNVVVEPEVTRVGSWAFSFCSNLTSISLPDKLYSVGANAFYECASLTEIRLPQTVAYLGSYAFCGCASLETAELPEAIKSIPDHAFYDCGRLSRLTHSQKLSSVGTYAFCNCVSLRSFDFPSGFNNIASYAFSGSGLIDVDIPRGGIQSYAFLACPALRTLKIRSGVTTIAAFSFYNCKELRDVLIEDGVSQIGMYAFSLCESITSLSLPDSVTVISANAFSFCKNLMEVRLPSGLTAIQSGLFAMCPALREIDIPYCVTRINSQAFQGCGKLTRVDLKEGVAAIGSYAFTGCGSLSSIRLPDSLVSIGVTAFSECGKLEQLTVPENVTFIGKSAFSNVAPGFRLYIPDSVTTLNELFSPSFAGTVYCHRGSAADAWTSGKNYAVVYVDDGAAGFLTVSLPADFSLRCGRSVQLTADVFPNRDHPAVVWSSSDPETASVDESGTVTGHRPGVVQITASVGSASAETRLLVYAAVEAFDLPSELWLAANDTLRIEPSNIEPAGAVLDLAWESGDESLFSVDAEGLVTALRSGDAALTARDRFSGVERSVSVHVREPVTAISFASEAEQMTPGSELRLICGVTSGERTFVNLLVRFESSDERVASVDGDGLVTAHSGGTAIITARAASGASAECSILVRDPNALILPAGMTAIEPEAFSGDAAIEALVIPEACETVGANAFSACASLRDVYVTGDTAFDETAFAGCEGLTFHCREGSAAADFANRKGFAVRCDQPIQ